MKYYSLSAIPFFQITLADTFWKSRLETNRTVTIPAVFEKCEKEGRIENFRRAADPSLGSYIGKMPFEDTDVYKALEGASYSLILNYDNKLDEYIDSLITLIAKAQEPDGYLYTNRTIDPANVHKFAGSERWSSLVQSHELYNSGHLYEAAYAHFQATGKRTLLSIALKNADLICSVFNSNNRHDSPGHEIIELGLVKLYVLTGNSKYLDTAKFFLEERGNHKNRPLYEFVGNPEYSQDHIPVTLQKTATGHAVRAVYLYCGMTDVEALTEGGSSYSHALDAIWGNMVKKRIYLTGGLGARHEGEAFGDDYQLPNLTAYNETCAAIGSVMWNQRMFLASGSGIYYDVLEQTLYNGLISGVSSSGDTFFYPNPLESDGKFLFNYGSATRSPWFDVSCCPTNLARFFPSLPGYIYAVKGENKQNNLLLPASQLQNITELYIELFVQSNTTVETHGSQLIITQETQYPWDGDIKIKIEPSAGKANSALKVHIRIPGWVSGNIMGGYLYTGTPIRACDQNEWSNGVQCSINNSQIPILFQNGHLIIERVWTAGDTIKLSLKMPVMEVRCDKNVVENRGMKALQRGPVVYCIEQIDSTVDINKLTIEDFYELEFVFNPAISGQIPILKGSKAEAIPYNVWSNRGEGRMKIWIREK